MKQILLVDDDFLSLNAFYALADWGRYGLRIAYEAHNGREALAYLENAVQPPDAAFIDVCMPDMDGIALLRALLQDYPSVLCFMLSSYSDYSYVREALKLGAADYLLKHEISPDGVIRLLAQHGLCLPMDAQEDDPEQRLQRALLGGVEEGLRGYLVCAVYQGERPLIEAQQRSILQTCRHILNDVAGTAVCAPAAGQLALLLPADEKDCAKGLAAAEQRASLLQKALFKYHNARYAFAPPHFCAGAGQIPGVYQLFVREHEPAAKPRSFLASRESAVLTLAVINGQKTIIDQTLRSLFLSAAKERYNELYNNLFSLLSHARQTLGLPAGERAVVPPGLAQAQAYFFEQFSALCDQNSSLRARRYSPAIRDALDYLGRHYAEDIHLGDVAKHCHLSYNHLSYLFKKETGDNIISCLNRIRIYHAAHLLLFDEASVADACQQAGFKGYNHFVQNFKTITSMTPTEFKRSPAAVGWLLSFSPTEADAQGQVK